MLELGFALPPENAFTFRSVSALENATKHVKKKIVATCGYI
jgi:hypothetical protein